MTGARITIDMHDVDRLQERLDRIASIGFGEVLDTIGAVVESQVRRRFSDDQEAPDGTPWKDWTDAYAKTRHGSHSLLIGDPENLLDSITHSPPSDDAVEVGSNMIYAGVQQFGFDERGIPARPYLGLSADNEDEIESVLHDWIQELLK